MDTQHNNNQGNNSAQSGTENSNNSNSAQNHSQGTKQGGGTPTNMNLNLDTNQIIGIAGAVLVLIGMFLPIYNVSDDDSFNYIDGSFLDQWLLILLLVAVVPLFALKKTKLAGIISLGIAGLVVGKFLFYLFFTGFNYGQSSISEFDIESGLGFGWLLLIVGAGAIAYASFSNFFKNMYEDMSKMIQSTMK
jgi:hypothetical protein